MLLVAVPALAPAAPSTYTGEAPVTSQSDEERAGALRTALANVVIEQTGDPGILARGEVAGAVAQAERYVVQYQYRSNPPGAEAPLTLVASFDSAAVDAMLGRLGLGNGSAAPGALDTPSEAVLWIGDIRDADDFLRVMSYLQRSNFARAVEPLAAQGDGMLVKVALATGLARFRDALGLERVLAPATSAPPAPADAADAVLALVH
jgi:hypothetical protein